MARKQYTRNTLNFDKLPQTMTLAQGALVLGVSETTVRRYIQEEGLPAFTVQAGPRSLYKLDKTQLLAWRESRTVNRPAAPAQAEPPVQVFDLSAETKQLFERLIIALERMKT